MKARRHPTVAKIIQEERERLKQETQARWEKEAENGKVVSHQTMIAWLDTWGTDAEAELTPSHSSEYIS